MTLDWSSARGGCPLEFVAVSQWRYVAFGACPASLVLAHAFAPRSAIYPKEALR